MLGPNTVTENLAMAKTQIWSVSVKLQASAIRRENFGRKIKVGLPELVIIGAT